VVSSPETAPAEDALDWLIALLRDAMAQVMASDEPALQKANLVARLAGHYLKAHRTAEIERANKDLRRRVAELEERVAAVETALAAPTAPDEKRPALQAAASPAFPAAPDDPCRGASSAKPLRPSKNGKGSPSAGMRRR